MQQPSHAVDPLDLLLENENLLYDQFGQPCRMRANSQLIRHSDERDREPGQHKREVFVLERLFVGVIKWQDLRCVKHETRWELIV